MSLCQRKPQCLAIRKADTQPEHPPFNSSKVQVTARRSKQGEVRERPSVDVEAFVHRRDLRERRALGRADSDLERQPSPARLADRDRERVHVREEALVQRERAQREPRAARAVRVRAQEERRRVRRGGTTVDCAVVRACGTVVRAGSAAAADGTVVRPSGATVRAGGAVADDVERADGEARRDGQAELRRLRGLGAGGDGVRDLGDRGEDEGDEGDEHGRREVSVYRLLGEAAMS